MYKPKLICRCCKEWEKQFSVDQMTDFIRENMERLEKSAAAFDLILRPASINDFEAIKEVQEECFSPPVLQRVSFYEIFRILSFGDSAVLTLRRGRIIGFFLVVSYNNPEKVSFGVRIGVSRPYNGHNLGAVLSRYTCFLSLEKGARIRKALMSPKNIPAITNTLNHVGYVCDTFYPRFPAYPEDARFLISLPLTPHGLMNQRVSQEKLRTYIQSRQEGVDYLLIAPNDIARLEAIYCENKFRVVAVAKIDDTSEDVRLFAVRIESSLQNE